MQQPRLAETYSRTALASRPGLASAHAQLGASFNLSGRFADARGELEEAVRLAQANRVRQAIEGGFRPPK